MLKPQKINMRQKIKEQKAPCPPKPELQVMAGGSCAMCKPNKTGHDCRWSAKELSGLKLFEEEKRSLVG